MPLPGTLNQEAKIPQVPPAPSWLCYQATFLAHVKQLGIITETESKQEEQQMYKDKQIDWQEAVRGDAVQLQCLQKTGRFLTIPVEK